MIPVRVSRALALFLTVALAACNQGPAHDPAADAASLDKAAAGWEAAYNDKNADAVAAIYTDDAQILPPGAAAVSGRAAVKDYWANDIATQWAKISVKADSSMISGDLAVRSGAWSIESPALTGKFVEVWKRSGDGWQLHKDIWNLDVTPAAPPPADAAAAPAAPAAQ
jgi:ketosteroid isomerase-like protein